MKSVISCVKNKALSSHFRYNFNLVFTSKYSSVQCWKCSQTNSKFDLFCQKCGIIQRPIETDNYFRLFNTEEQFQINQKYLKDKFRQLQSLLHPDKFSYKTEEEKLISKDYSSLLNRAYNTLLTPMARAEYLLKLKGQKVEESETVNNPKFLMEIMELNEKVEEAGTDVDKLKILDKENKEVLEQLSNEITQHFKTDDIEKAKEKITKMKYFNSVCDRINETLRELGVAD